MPRILLLLLLVSAGAAEGQKFSGLVTEAEAPETGIRGAVIRIRQAGAERLTAELETGLDGRFEAAVPLPAGEYGVEIRKAQYASVRFPIRLPAEGPLAVSLLRFGTISGRVTDGQNRPLAGASVMVLVPAEEDAAVLRPARQAAVARVDRDGNYRLFHLAPGRYAVAVTWANMGNGGREAPVVGAYVYPSNTKPMLFAVNSGTAISGIHFTLPAQSDFTVAGRVTGLPAKQNAAVALTLRDQPHLAAALLQTSGEGEYRFEHVAPGAYDLRAAAPMRGYGATGGVLGPGALFGQIRIDLGGQNVEGVELPLGPAGALRVTLASTAECRAVAATVWLDPVENWAALPAAPATLRPDEELVVKELAPGRYRLRVTKAEGGCFEPPPVVVDVREGRPIRLALQPPGVVEVRLGTPGAVMLQGVDEAEAPARLLTVATDGKYRFAGLRPGRYRVRAGKMAGEVDVRPGTTTETTLRAEEEK